MTRGERWVRLFTDKGWLIDDVISGGEKEKLNISIRSCEGEGRKATVIDTALVMKDYEILCYESRSGTVFFQWDDIVQVRLEEDSGKKGWL